MTKYTQSEAAAINAAWRAINDLCSRTNWSDSGEWKRAEKAERAQAGRDCPQPSTWARAMICKAWAEGFDNPEAPASRLYWIRAGYRDALFLGVRHAIERAGDSYTGPLVAECREKCAAAISAHEAHSRRIVEG